MPGAPLMVALAPVWARTVSQPTPGPCPPAESDRAGTSWLGASTGSSPGAGPRNPAAGRNRTTSCNPLRTPRGGWPSGDPPSPGRSNRPGRRQPGPSEPRRRTAPALGPGSGRLPTCPACPRSPRGQRPRAGAWPMDLGLAPRPVIGADAGARHAPRGGSVCVRRLPDRGVCARLQPAHRRGQLGEAAGDILGAVDLRPENVSEPGELRLAGRVELLHGLLGSAYVLLECQDLALGLLTEGGERLCLGLELRPCLSYELLDHRRRTFRKRALAGLDAHHSACQGGHVALECVHGPGHLSQIRRRLLWRA
eukprot:12077558-Alexandrium_andersonii.AAC.1